MKHLVLLLLIFFTLIFSSCSLWGEQSWEQEIVLNIPEAYTIPEIPEWLTVKGENTLLQWELLQRWDILQDILLDKKADYFDEVDSTLLSEFPWVKLIQTVPSLDTPVCTFQTKQLEAAAKRFTDTQFITISNDTPFALQRFCSANSIDNLITLSDARSREFWEKNNFFLPEYGLLTRSIMIVDENLEILYIEYAEEVTSELNLENALSFLQSM